MNTRLDGKTALICGASQGIGAACARTFAKQGARVVLLSRQLEKLKALQGELENSSQHYCMAIDLLDRKALETAVQECLSKLGPISILICNSGGPAGGPLLEADDEVFLKSFSQHLLANQSLVRLLVPGMKETSYGRIINIISTSVKAPIPNLGVSNTIRGAVANWGKTLSLELANAGITVNNVLPGYTETPRLNTLMEASAVRMKKSVGEIKKDWEDKIPMGRFANPSELADAVCFLASPAASYINGINLPVDGGRTPSL